MEKTNFKLLFFVGLLIFVVFFGNVNHIGAEASYVSKRCRGPDDCASWGPECHCDMGLHACVCNVPPSGKSHLNFNGMEEGY
ncbi:unnamed protein product [Linum tenue]|uniref:Uncharacterized protein n=1 Tax=Linum tenue TaxID=586396 RepID=A0AAV0IF83_9ROSI|nr:unnamed protein product [Linum tenue]